MAVKLADTLAPMGDFPVAEGKDVGVQIGEKSKSLQKAIEDGDLGGGGGSSLIDDEVIAEDSTWSSKKISEFGEALDKKVEDVDTKVGDLEELKTTEKGSVVGAVNEISDSLVDIDTKVDGKADKTDLDKLLAQPYITALPSPTTDGTYSVYDGDSSFPYPYGRLEIRRAATDAEFYATYNASGVNGRTYVNLFRQNAWGGWQELATMDKVASNVIRRVINFDNVEVSANSTLQILKDCSFNGYTPLMINAQVWSNTDEIIVSGSYVSSDNKGVILLRNIGNTADTTINIVCTVLYVRNA